jgi:hypothetical protein
MARQNPAKPVGGPPTCEICKRTIDIRNENSYYYKVAGWTKKRAGGGTNSIRLTEALNLFAHRTCVDLAADGIHIRQGSLL